MITQVNYLTQGTGQMK